MKSHCTLPITNLFHWEGASLCKDGLEKYDKFICKQYPWVGKSQVSRLFFADEDRLGLLPTSVAGALVADEPNP